MSDADYGIPANTPESIKSRIIAARLLQQSAAAPSAPYTSKAVVGLKALSGLLGGLQEQRALDEARSGQQAGNAQLVALANALRGGATSPATGIPGSAATASAAAPSGSGASSTDYLGRLGHVESGGRDGVSNSASGATGRYQFIGSTWSGLAQRYPDLGLTPDGRTDPAQQERAIRALTNENASALGRAGFQATPGNLYLAHFAGPGGAVGALKANPNTPVEQVLGGAAVNANPFLRGKTAGDLVGWANGKMAGVDPSSVPGAPAASRTMVAGGAPPSLTVPSPSAPVGDAAVMAARNRLVTGQGSAADRATVATYLQQQNTPQPARTAAADVPAPNAQPVASSALPPGITPDMVSAPPSPYGAMPPSMAQPAADPKLLAALLARRQAAGSRPGATPPPPSVQPSSPFGAMPTSMDQAPASVPGPAMAGMQPPVPSPSPFGAGPSPMQPPANNALAAALLRKGSGAPQLPADLPQMAGLGLTGDPSAMGAQAAALPPVQASGLSTDSLPGFDNFGQDGSVRQSSLGAAGFTGAPADGSVQAGINGDLRGPTAYVGGPLGLGTGPAQPPPDPQVLASLLAPTGGAPAGGPAPGAPPPPAAAPAPQAPPPAPNPAPQAASAAQTAALMPGSVDDFGRTPDQAMNPGGGIATAATKAMQAAGYDVSGLPGAPPSAKPPLPTLAGPGIPAPDLSGLAGPAASGGPASLTKDGLPIFAQASSTPPAAVQQIAADLRPVPPSARQPNTSATSPSRSPSLQPPDDAPLPPTRPAGLNPDLPAPGATQAGPAPASPRMLAQMLRQPAQPMGLPGNSPVSDPSSAQSFTRQEAMRAQGQPSPGVMASLLRGQSPASSASTSQTAGGPLDALSGMFGGGSGPMGGSSGGLGGMLSGLPIIGGLLGGSGMSGPNGNPFAGLAGGFGGGSPSPTSAPASSPAYGGQGAGQPFAPGGQGQPQGGQGVPAGQAGQQQAGAGAQARSVASAILQNQYASPEAREAASKVLFAMPELQKMEDGTLISVDPFTKQTTVVGRYGKAVDAAPGHALLNPYTGAVIGAPVPTPDRYRETPNGSILDQSTGRTAADPNAFTMSSIDVGNGVKVPIRVGRNPDGSPNVQMMVPGAASGGQPSTPGAAPAGPLDAVAPLVKQSNDMAARAAAQKEGAVDQVKGANTFVQAAAKTGSEAATHVQEMQQLKALGAAAPTGYSADLARYAADHGLVTANGDAVKSYDGLRSYLGTQLRQAGSGALRNSEMDKLSDALGSTNTSPATRAAAVQRIQDGFARQAALGQVASDASVADPLAKQARIQDVQQTWMNADAAIEAHPDKKAAIIAKMQAAGYPVVGF